MSADGAVTDDTNDVDDAGEGAPDAGAAPAGTEPDRETRRERRRNEFQAAQDSAREAREELARERTERERLASQVAEISGRLRERDAQSERDRQSQRDPREDQIKELRRVGKRHLEAVGNAKTPQDQQDALDAYHDTVEQASSLRFEINGDAKARKNPPQQQNGGLGAREVAIITAIEGDFPTFVDRGKAGAEFRARADMHLNILLAQGKPDGLATYRAACAEAAKEMRIGGKSTGSTNRERFGASGAGDGAGGGGEGDRGSVPIGRTEEALAIALANRSGKGLTKEQALADWNKRVGPGVKRRMSDE